MRARFAYISSLGTTAILVAAALLMLALVSAIVAFRGWPAGANGGGVRTVPLAPQGGAERVALVRHTARAGGLERTVAAPRAAAIRRFVSTAGLVRSKGPRGVPGLVMDPNSAASMQAAPNSPRSAHQSEPIPTPGAPERPVPDQPQGPVPSGGGGITIPLPVPGAQAPSADQVTSAVGSLLAGAAPPPPLLAEVRSHR